MGPPTSKPPQGASVEGRAVGPYVLERRLGAGGMAEVFLARKPLGPGMFKHVVVKRMLTDLIDDERFTEMFLREAGILAQLDHPNVVQIFDLGADENELYIALEYLDGISLQQLAFRSWRAHEPVPLELVIRVLAEIARGLDYVHRRRGPDGAALNLVHRDVSPDNLFMVRDGTVKLLDFGVARGANTKLLTAKGELKGKVPYMSPEQLEGAELDGRSDLYSLGVTAYWLLTGRRPFRGPTEVAIMRAILRDAPEAIAATNKDVPEWLAGLVLALLEKDRARRPQTGAEVDRVITSLGAHMIDVDDDAAFIAALLAMPDHDLDDVSHPMPAVPRKRTTPPPGSTRPRSATAPGVIDVGPGYDVFTGAQPAAAPTPGPAAPPDEEPSEIADDDLEPVETDIFETSPTQVTPAPTSDMLDETRPVEVSPAPPRLVKVPLRSLGVDMPVHEEGGDTLRTTESQLIAASHETDDE